MGEVNLGRYKMESLREMVHPSPLQISVPVKLVRDFPSFPGFRLAVFRGVTEEFSAGIQVGVNSTGRRFSYSDYTASVNYDTKLHCVSIGLFTEFKIFEKNNWQLVANLPVTTIYNVVHISTVVDSQYLQVNNAFKVGSFNVGVQPGISVGRKIGSIFLRGNCYYEYNSPGQLQYYNSDVSFTNSNYEPVIVEWDGLRAGIAVVYTFQFGD